MFRSLTIAVAAATTSIQVVQGYRITPVHIRIPTAVRSKVVAFQSTDDDDGNHIDSEKVRPLPAGDDDKGYGIVGTLLRQGPVPCFHRMLNPQEYELGVQKYMMIVGCSRKEAQGNLDAALGDPNSWVLNKLHARNGKVPAPDYANQNMSKQQVALTGTWGIAIALIILKAIAGVPSYLAAHPDWDQYFARMVNGIPNLFP
mmetsp:Transcript_8850/g.25739  ORF Transcript_8850/g.25739 Transcript_8850/m.25739 type:complete len:201 (-) Transcript_8850:193-795(-)